MSILTRTIELILVTQFKTMIGDFMYIVISDTHLGLALLAVWSIDIYLFLVLLRATIGRFPVINRSGLCRTLRKLTDTFPNAIRHLLNQPANSRMWLPLLTVIATFILARHLLVIFIADYAPK